MKRINKDVSYERITLLQSKLKEAGRINKLHQELIEKLKADLARAKEEHQYDNLVHKKELKDLREWNPKLDGSEK
jgi:hypothetical protein